MGLLEDTKMSAMHAIRDIITPKGVQFVFRVSGVWLTTIKSLASKGESLIKILSVKEAVPVLLNTTHALSWK